MNTLIQKLLNFLLLVGEPKSCPKCLIKLERYKKSLQCRHCGFNWEILLMGVLLLIGCVSAATYSNGFNYSQTFNITGNTGWASAQTNYPVYIDVYNTTGNSTGSTLYLNGNLKNPRRWTDILFTTGGKSIPQNIERKNTTYAQISLNISSIPNDTTNQTITVYYGKANAQDTSNGKNVYPYFDGWDYNMTYFTNSPFITHSVPSTDSWATDVNNAEILQDPTNSSVVDIWYNTNVGKIGYANTTDPALVNWTKYANNPLTDFGYPKGVYSVVYDYANSRWLMMLNDQSKRGTVGGAGNFTLWYSTNKIHWTIMNGGSPVLNSSSTLNALDSYLINSHLQIINNSLVVIVDGTANATDNAAGKYHEFFAYTNLTELNFTAHFNETPIFDQYSGTYGYTATPDFNYVPDRNAYLIFTGVIPSGGYFTIYSGYANATDPLHPSGWTLNPAANFNINTPGQHVGNPCTIITNNTRDWNVVLIYTQAQSSGDSMWGSGMSLDEFYDSLKYSNSAGWWLNGTPTTYNSQTIIDGSTDKIFSSRDISNGGNYRVRYQASIGSTAGGTMITGTSNGATVNYGAAIIGQSTGVSLINDAWDAVNAVTTDTASHLYSITHNGTGTITAYSDGTQKTTVTTGNNANGKYITFATGIYTTGNIVVDWVAAGKFISPEPSIGGWTVENTQSAPVASFSRNITGSLPMQLAIGFTDTSTNSPTSWQWSMGDGTANKTTANVSYKYTKRGLFTMIETVTNSAGSSSASTQVRVV